MDQITLDKILENYKAQPVGHGYIDIIVSRDNYKAFISDIVKNGYIIENVSWWEWCEDKNKNIYGLGGPESIFYKGWFSEIPVDLDDFSFSLGTSKENIIMEVLNKIETKKISFFDEIVVFNESKWLTPAIWLNVPDDWRNRYCR